MALLKLGRSVRTPRKHGLFGAVVAVVSVTTALLVVPGTTAAADPAPASASDAQTRLAELSRQSEETNEALLNAQIDLDAKQQQVRDAQASEAVSQAALDAANATIAAVRPAVDKLANANYQGARTNRLFAVMVSTSPQQMLDQMSALDIISHETAQQVDQFQRASSDAAASEAAAASASAAAQQAALTAKAVSDDLQNKQGELQVQIGQVIAAFGALTATEQSALAGTPMPPGFDPSTILKNLVPGSDASALIAGMTQIGKPYVWGATGPDSFDCSGLMVWAYKQIGKSLPRTSQAQAAGGTPVAQKDLQPGDLVLFYPDASHVGMYAGNGNVLHASTFGVPVKIQSMASFPYYGARRY